MMTHARVSTERCLADAIADDQAEERAGSRGP
jgi:hypothetical protein